MDRRIFAVCFLLLAQNAFAQVLPVTTGLLGNAVTGLSTGNLATNIANTVVAGNTLTNFADSSAIAKNIGMNLANNAAANNLAVANGAVGNFGVPNNNFNGISLGGLTNVQFGEVEYFKDGVINGFSGEYPMIGYVTFEGYLPATGTVSVAGDGCGCK